MSTNKPKKFYAKTELALRYSTTPRSFERWVAAGRYPGPDLALPIGRKRWSDGLVERHEKASAASAAASALRIPKKPKPSQVDPP
jgi:hypothetical protein